MRIGKRRNIWIIVLSIISYTMNKKNKDNPTQNNNKERQPGEPLTPKFKANWINNIQFDRIVINLSDCEYDVLGRVAKELKFKIKRDSESPDWDIWWTDWHVQAETLLKMEHHQKINHFPGMFNLSRKNLLAKNLMRMRKKSPDDYNFFPLTWNLPGDLNEFRLYYESKPKGKSRTYIVKPQSMSQGKGIFLTKKIQEIPLDQRFVVQRYLSRPYLIDGLKFDLRIYVLLAGVDPLKLFIYQEGLARFATQTYVTPNKDNIDDICMHLTNYAINKESEKFIFNEDSNDMSKGHKRSLTSIYSLLAMKGVDVTVLKNKIHQLIVKTIISGLSHLRFQYRSSQHQNYRSDMCFEILGFDVILTQDLQPYLLQINYTPSFSTDTPLDQKIKKNLIKDTLILMQTTKQFKQRTINQRKQLRNARMLTGKTNKLSPQERKDKIIQAQQQRDAYIAMNMGGFTKIYPFEGGDESNGKLMEKYQYLMEIEDDLLSRRKEKTSEIKDSNDKPAKVSQNKKLIPIEKRTPKNSFKLVETKNLRKMYSIEHFRNPSQDILDSCPRIEEQTKKVYARDLISVHKKPMQRKQTLTLKSIHFEGGRFDGFCQNYKQNMFF